MQATLQTRFEGDRTGACAVAALIEKGQVLRAKTCATPRADGGPGYGHVLEIGSVSKTMTAYLVAGLVREGKWQLDDPIAKHLPPGTELPRQGERQILVRDLLTHSSGLPGLPPGFAPKNASDPYADLSEAQLLAALGQVKLQHPIGSRFEYSNFGMMLISAAVARSLGGNFEQALTQRLFQPLKMQSSFINTPRGKAPLAQGHLASGQPTNDWHAATNLSGVGMVRASLDDMVRYAQAQLGLDEGKSLPPALLADMHQSQQPLREHSAMNWMRFKALGHELVAHEGGTGGFSSVVALEPAAQRAVVVLSDASLADLGGLGDVANALLGLTKAPTPQARKPAQPSAALLAAMPGQYSLGGLGVRIWLQGEQLMAQADGQSAFELGYDSRGDFYPRTFSALLSPVFEQGRVDRALWRQGGGAVEVLRVQPLDKAASRLVAELLGEYELAPQFILRVFEDEGQLKVQGSGQPAITAQPAGADRLEIKAVGAVLEFKRDAAGRVVAALLQQNGQTLEGKRR